MERKILEIHHNISITYHNSICNHYFLFLFGQCYNVYYIMEFPRVLTRNNFIRKMNLKFFCPDIIVPELFCTRAACLWNVLPVPQALTLEAFEKGLPWLHPRHQLPCGAGTQGAGPFCSGSLPARRPGGTMEKSRVQRQ